MSHNMRLDIDFLASLGPFRFNEIILLLQTFILLLADLLLAELSLIEVIFTHAVQIVFNLIFLSTHLVDSSHLLISEVSVAVHDLCSLLFLTLQHSFFIGFRFSLTLLLGTLSHENLIVVLVLEILQLARLLSSLVDLFHGTHLFIL